MASAYCRRWSSSLATLMRQRLASVLTSYSSPTLTFFEALAAMPLYFTLPLSQASAASVRVLKRRMDHKYLSRGIFSFSGISFTGGWILLDGPGGKIKENFGKGVICSLSLVWI